MGFTSPAGIRMSSERTSWGQSWESTQGSKVRGQRSVGVCLVTGWAHVHWSIDFWSGYWFLYFLSFILISLCFSSSCWHYICHLWKEGSVFLFVFSRSWIIRTFLLSPRGSSVQFSTLFVPKGTFCLQQWQRHKYTQTYKNTWNKTTWPITTNKIKEIKCHCLLTKVYSNYILKTISTVWGNILWLVKPF